MSPRILIADDDFDNRAIAQDALQASGYETVLATDGAEALELAVREKPDLILLDLSMPKVNGWDVAKRLRAQSDFQNTPIVAFTAHAFVGEAERAIAVGCNDYIAKPCQPRTLLERVRYWLERSPASSSEKGTA